MVDRIPAGRSCVDRVSLAGGLGHRAWLVRLLREGRGGGSGKRNRIIVFSMFC